MALETEQGTLRELALARSLELIAGLSAKDEVLLYAVEEQPFDVGGGTLSPAVAENLLKNWRWGEGGTALRAALLKAQRALRRQPRYQKEIYVISDFAAATMDTVGLQGAEAYVDPAEGAVHGEVDLLLGQQALHSPLVAPRALH